MSERKRVLMKADHRELHNGHRYVLTTVRAEALERGGFCDILGDFEEPAEPVVERAVKAPARRRRARKKKR